MLRIRYIDGGDWLGLEFGPVECFQWHFGKSSVFGGQKYSSHFGTPDFDIFFKSYLFPTEDGGVTDIVINIHESRQDRERLDRRMALLADAEHRELLARCDRRRNRKKIHKR